MPTCQQCGKCCLGLDWTFTFPGKDENAENPSTEVRKKAQNRMRFYGLLFNSFKSAEKKEDAISLTYSVGICQHLGYQNGKALCKIHENRPEACRNYHCDKCRN